MMSAQAPRWLDILRGALSEEKTPAYILSTVLSTSSGVFPRSRSVIHRAIVMSSLSRPLFLTTTDIRSPKAHQLHVNTNTEATFWFPKSNTQFRIVGLTYLLPQPSHPWHVDFPWGVLSGGEDKGIDWDLERLKVFDSISGHLRATFARPFPGSPMGSYDEANNWPVTIPKCVEGECEEQLRNIETALSNFALVVMEPTEIDLLELSPIPNKRTTWTKTSKDWEESIVVP